MNDLIIMERQNIVDIADAIRNKTGVNDEMTLVDMVTNINEIELGGEELPSAENSVFGMTSQVTEYGMTNSPTGMQQLAVTASGGVEYKANVPFAILGVRVCPARQSWSGSVYIWNDKGELLRQVDGLNYTGGWTEPVYLTQPLNIKAGETFIISMTWYGNCGYMNKSKITFNSKISFQCGRYIQAREGFPDQTNTSKVYGMPDIIIGDTVEELPLEYQIQRTTMDDIAEEVQRITGIENKMSTAQIISNLSEIEIENLEDYEEVTF